MKFADGSAGPTSSASMRVKYNKNIFLPAYLLDMVKRYGKILACKLLNH